MSRNIKIKDERIIAEHNKITNSTFYLIILFLFISLGIKIFILNESYRNYLTEAIVIPIGILCVLIRNVMKGNYEIKLKKSNMKSYVLVSFFVGIGGVISSGFNNYSKYINTPGGVSKILILISIMFLSAFITSFGFLMAYDYFSKKQLKKISQQCGEE